MCFFGIWIFNNRVAKNWFISFILIGGRRGAVSLGHILKFITGTDEEPVLGFALHPSITFVEAESESKMIPTASTYINQLRLPRPSVGLKLLEESKLFSLYDYAFTNDYFGQVWRLLVALINKPIAFWNVFKGFRNGLITNKKENLT